ncbi:MAG: DUF2059 domain-containing protein [Opitutaceae bacterium]|nr:DUF2059 domain-containing protein [Opitutaceae bacterium]
MKRILLLAFPLIALVARAEDARLTLAREVIELTQADKMINQLVPQIQQMTAQMSAPMLDKLTPEQKAKVEESQKRVVAIAMESAKAMLAKFDTVYAEVYSEAELKAMKAFFLSSEGKSMIEKQPALMQKMMPIMQEMQRELMPKVQAAMGDLQQTLQATTPSQPAVGLPPAAPAAPQEAAK